MSWHLKAVYQNENEEESILTLWQFHVYELRSLHNC